MLQGYALKLVLLCLILTSIAGFIQAIQFIRQPSNTSVLNGSENVVLQCKVDTSIKTTWFKDGLPLTEDYIKYTFTTAGLRIKPVEKSDAGKYYCKAGSIESRTATLTVEYVCKDGFQIKTSGGAFRGEDFTLTCDCAAVPAPTYTWQKDGSILTNFTGRDLLITNSQKSKDDGEYVCSVDSNGRQAKSLPHNLDVFNCSPARIVIPPDQEIVFAVKKPLTIKCDATGEPRPKVLWYQGSSTTALRNTSRIQIHYHGALYFTKTQADDAGEYKCLASNSCDQSKTYTTTLVIAKIGEFSPMTDSLNRVRSTVSITCDPPSESIPPIKNITWQLGNGNPVPRDPRFKVIGNTLQIETAGRADSGTYTCVAENIAGKKTVDVNVIVAIYPEVTLDPANKTIIEDESVTLECKFSGDPKPTIIWEKNGETLPDNVNTKITKTVNGSILTISKAVGDQSGLYRCSATLKHVTERTKEARLTVKEKVVLDKIGSAKFDEGKVAKLNCRIAAGTGPFEILWVKEGLSSGLLPHMKVEESKLVINKAKMSDTGNYTCYINNSFSSASLRFSIHIYDFTIIVSRPRNVTVMVNDSAMFNCKATGKPKPEVIWYEGKRPDEWQQVVYDSRVVRLANDSLLLKSVEERDARQYKCIAGNPGLIVEDSAFLIIGSGNGKSSSADDRDTDEHEPDNMGKTVGIAVGCAGAYIILVVGLMIYCKGRRARQAKKKLIINGEDVPLKPEENGENIEVVKSPEVSNARQFSRADFETLRTLGSGTYGNVFLAKASEIVEGESSSIVVVQSLTATDEAVKKDFMRRMEMLSLKHENIAKLLGVCQEEEPMYLISEYPEQGDLKTVMRDSSSPLNPSQKLNICAAVASGMNYLTTHGHVHKDLAARNCLVNKSFDVKISFLSLNQGTYPKEYYKRGEELIPLRWMAPEALNGEYSDMSDVWSFGVLMWEVYTEGILPYEERPDEEVLHSVGDDLRLTKPEGCPGKIYKLMEKCWADDKEDRLTFGELREDISEIPRESDF